MPWNRAVLKLALVLIAVNGLAILMSAIKANFRDGGMSSDKQFADYNYNHLRSPATAKAAGKRWVVMSIALTRASERPYALYVPIVVLAWSQLGWKCAVLVVGEEEVWQTSRLYRKIEETTVALAPETVFVVVPVNYNSVSFAQVLRAFAPALVPEIQDDEYVITSDIDILQITGPSYTTTWPTVWNARCCGSFDWEGRSIVMHPMTSIGMNASEWKRVMRAHSWDDPQTDLQDWLRKNGEMIPKDDVVKGGGDWLIDQRVVSVALASEKINEVVRSTSSDRIDRARGYQWAGSIKGKYDAHMPLPADSKWDASKHILKQVFPAKTYKGLEQYYTSYKQEKGKAGSYFEVVLPFAERPIQVLPGVAQKDWWTSVSDKKWELATFRAFNQEMPAHGSKTLNYIGFGEWVGVTGLFAAGRVEHAVLMDADPKAFSELTGNVDANKYAMPSKLSTDKRCISNVKEKRVMKFNGGSGSSILKTTPWSKNFEEVEVDCIPLQALVEEYGMASTLGRTFIKIDTEGAESIILPSLLEWIRSVPAPLPTMFISMHDMATPEQRSEISSLLNLWPYYAIVPGERDGQEENLSGPGVDNKKCETGIPVVKNNDGKRFSRDNICRWCDYLLVATNANSNANCGTQVV